MAGAWDIQVDQGADYRPSPGLWLNDDKTPIDLSSYTARLQIRSDYDSTIAITDLTSGNGITLGADGSIAPVILATATAAWVVDESRLKYVKHGRRVYEFGVYELKLTSPLGEVTTLLAGTVFLGPAVIKAGA